MVNSNYRHMEKLPESNSNRWPRPVQMRGETPRTGLLALRRGCRCIAFLAACCFGLTATAQNPSSYVPTKGEIVFSLYQSSEGKPIHTRLSNPLVSAADNDDIHGWLLSPQFGTGILLRCSLYGT